LDKIKENDSNNSYSKDLFDSVYLKILNELKSDPFQRFILTYDPIINYFNEKFSSMNNDDFNDYFSFDFFVINNDSSDELDLSILI
jgi:hypothetical protein